MPPCTLHLVSLDPSTSIPAFLFFLSSQSPPIRPLLASRVIHWIIRPTTINADDLLYPPYPWDLLLLLPGSTQFPSSVQSKIRNIFTLTSGVPSRLLGNDFWTKNKALLHPNSSSIPPIDPPDVFTETPSSDHLPKDSQNLTLSPDFLAWARDFSRTMAGSSPLSMLNLLAFQRTETAKKDYQAYGAAFAKSIGSRHGGNAKIMGNVIHDRPGDDKGKRNKGPSSGNNKNPDQSNFPSASLNPTQQHQQQPPPQGQAGGEWEWDEIAVAQYPSISHFATMLGSRDYQEVNRRYRVPSLRDTCILCTSEIAVENQVKEWEEWAGRRAKL